MRLYTLTHQGTPTAAVQAGDGTLVPISQIIPGGPADLLSVIQGGPDVWDRVRRAAASARGGTSLDQADLLAPLPQPRRNVFCVGWNYLEHFDEGKGKHAGVSTPDDIPEYPTFFSKQPNTVIGTGKPAWFPAPHSTQLDWEAELTVVIGRAGREIPEERAFEHVFGYTVADDLSVRDLQRRHGGQWFKGKNFDTHLPMGPAIVTADEVPDPHALHIGTRVNGVTKQDSNTKFMVFRIPRLIRELSAGMLLEPGDLIITGTPSGVGYARNPPEFLHVGDTVEVEVENIGVVRTTIETYPGDV